MLSFCTDIIILIFVTCYFQFQYLLFSSYFSPLFIPSTPSHSEVINRSAVVFSGFRPPLPLLSVVNVCVTEGRGVCHTPPCVPPHINLQLFSLYFTIVFSAMCCRFGCRPCLYVLHIPQPAQDSQTHTLENIWKKTHLSWPIRRPPAITPLTQVIKATRALSLQFTVYIPGRRGESLAFSFDPDENYLDLVIFPFIESEVQHSHNAVVLIGVPLKL